MIVPYSTDAPIYHYPWATLGMIATNVVIHVVAHYVVDGETALRFTLETGTGLHPIQWLSNNFLHADWLHLIGNMVFLWSYGIIVEGKIGWWAFLLSYLGIGTLYGASIQVAFLGDSEPTHVLGASAIIFGLLAIAMVWAPANELSCFYFFFVGFRIFSGTFEWPIYAFALLQLFFQGLEITLVTMISGSPMSSALLHLSGAVWGLAAGLILLKAGWVDCEGWDVFSLKKRRKGLREAWDARGARLDRKRDNDTLLKSTRAEEDRPGLSTGERAEKLLAKVHGSIEAGDAIGAQAACGKWLTLVGNRAPREALLGIVKAMHAKGQHAESVSAMRALCRLHPESAGKVRLKLASILVRQLERPTEARRHLLLVSDNGLDAPQREYRRKLLVDADRMIEEGVLEVEEEA